MYHRIATPASDPWGLAVRPDRFAQQLELLKTYGEVVPLARLGQGARGPRPQFALTFDDICQDNLDKALPALDRHGVPATMFAVSGAIGAGHDYWWDALARAILETERLPATLDLEVGAFRLHHDLGAAATCPPGERAAIRCWRVEDRPPTHPRERLYWSLWQAIDAAPAEAREALCAAVLEWAGLPREVPEADRPLDEAGVHALAEGGLVEIGGHSMSHLPLDTLGPAAASAEIEGCRSRLREVAGREVTSFSYPFGRFRPETAGLLRAAGFTQACDSRRGVAFAGIDRHHLPRIVVPEIDGEGLSALLQSLVRA